MLLGVILKQEIADVLSATLAPSRCYLTSLISRNRLFLDLPSFLIPALAGFLHAISSHNLFDHSSCLDCEAAINRVSLEVHLADCRLTFEAYA